MGTGSEGTAGAFVLFFAVGFLATVVTSLATGEGSVTVEGGWAVDAD